ncbi:uncharacterized protein FFE2_16088 [Fusarium fujikuroi]|nr:uncharacterized protein FFE2_16088 [Fusarium fujikuroi]
MTLRYYLKLISFILSIFYSNKKNILSFYTVI